MRPRHDVSKIVLTAALSFLAGVLWTGDSVESLKKSNENMYRLYLADRAAIGACSRYSELIRALEVSRTHRSPLDQLHDAKAFNADALPWSDGGQE